MLSWERPETSIVSTKGQVVIPESIRKRYHIDAGTRICFFSQGDNILIRPVTRESIAKLRGALGTKGRALKMLLEERKRDKDRDREK